MSCLGLKRQLLHTKKVLKNSTSALRSKLYKLKTPKALKFAATHLNAIFGRRGRTTRSLYHHRHRKFRTKKLHRRSDFASVYIDELYNQQMPVHIVLVEAPLDDLKETKAIENGIIGDNLGLTIDGASSSPCSMSPLPYVDGEMSEVDIRAEIFIRKFKEEMKLQRQKSFKKYQEMLARGV